jgi:chromosome partitioning protein
MGKIIAVANQKGGVGKTTTTVNLGACLSKLGQKVLLVDIDPQGNLTGGLGIEKSTVEHDMYDVIIHELPIEGIIVPVTENLSVAPATLNLSGADIELTQLMARETRLKSALAKARKVYDYILIDCPPALGLLTINAFTASDSILMPVQAEYYALEGLTQMMKTMGLVRKHFNPDLKIEGVLITLYDKRTNLGSEVVDNVRTYFKEKVYDTIIRRNITLAEAPSAGMSIVDYDPRSIGAIEYQQLAKEVLARG